MILKGLIIGNTFNFPYLSFSQLPVLLALLPNCWCMTFQKQINQKCPPCLSTKTLYSLLPALLDTNPFSGEEKKAEKEEARGAEGEAKKVGDGEVDDVSTLPPKVAGLVEVYRCSLMLSREACLSPPLTSQTFGYLFFFTNTSLLNTLLERGESVCHCDHQLRCWSYNKFSVFIKH